MQHSNTRRLQMATSLTGVKIQPPGQASLYRPIRYCRDSPTSASADNLQSTAWMSRPTGITQVPNTKTTAQHDCTNGSVLFAPTQLNTMRYTHVRRGSK